MADRKAQGVVRAAILDHQVGALVLQVEVQEGEERPYPAIPQGRDIHPREVALDPVPALDQQLPGCPDSALQLRRGRGLLAGEGERFRCSSRVVERWLLYGFDKLVGQETAGEGDVI